MGVVLASDQATVQELQVEWAFNTSDVFQGRLFGPGRQSCQTVWDVDGDGENEVVFGTRRGDSNRMWCIDQDGQFEWIYPPIEDEGLPGHPMSKVSLVDVDNDGEFELSFAGRGGRLHVIDGNGQVVWIWDNPTDADMYGAPQALDVDGDGWVEFFVTDNQGFVHRLNHEGEPVWTSTQGPGANLGHPTVCDIDRDGGFEVLWANNDRRIYCADAATGENRWSFNTTSTMKYNPVLVADIDSDEEYEAIAWTDAPGEVICLDAQGRQIWNWSHPQRMNIRDCQAMGDIDGDGGMELVILSDWTGFCLDFGDFTPEIQWTVNFTEWVEDGSLPEGAAACSWCSYQLIADIDGDRGLEVLWLAPYPIVTDAGTGELEAHYMNEFVAVGPSGRHNSGWWGDIDRDGVSEWIAELNGKTYPETQVYCLTAGGSFPAESPWPEYYHCAYPAGYQCEQDWLTLKSAGSNSLWFPIPEASTTLCIGCLAYLFIPIIRRIAHTDSYHKQEPEADWVLGFRTKR